MKKVPRNGLILFCLVWASCFSADYSVYTADRDVRLLARTSIMSFGGVGLLGQASSDEILVRRLAKRDDAFRCFVEVYNIGTPAAKVYALAYFHHSAPELFEICWADNIGKYNPAVRSATGCLTMEGSLTEHLFRIKLGEYDPFIERAVKGGPRLSLK